MNRVILIGNVGRDPEVRKTNGDMSIARFSLATNRWYKSKNEVTWHRCVVFGRLAESVVEPYVSKGTKLSVEGRIQHRKYEDKKTGLVKEVSEVIAENIGLLSGGKRESPRAANNNWSDGAADPDSEVPF